MDGRRRRAVGASLTTMAALMLAAAPVALASAPVSVSSVSSLKAGASAGTLQGTVHNGTSRPVRAEVAIRLHRRGTKQHILGRTTVRVHSRSSAPYSVNVKLPANLARGNYYLSACTPIAGRKGAYDCATSENDIAVKGGTPVRGPGVMSALAKASQAPPCGKGKRTLSAPHARIYPETGNAGYTSLHSDVFINYDAPSNLFLPGTHVDLKQRATQC